MTNILADRLAEASAGMAAQKVQKQSGALPIPRGSHYLNYWTKNFRSIRPAYGYPACPDHSEIRKNISTS